MKIALLTDGIWPYVIGGMQKHSYYLCKFLARNRVYVDLYHTAPKKDDINLSVYFNDEELKYIRPFFVEWPQLDKLPGHYIRASWKYSKNVLELIRQNGWPELIYAKGLTSWSLLKNRLADERMPPVCINVHGYEYYQRTASFKTRFQQLILRPPFRFINEHADYIYSYGGKITSIIKCHIRNRKGTIIEIPTGIEEDFLVDTVKGDNSIRQFVFIGRYERRKGICELTEAIIKLSGKYKFRFHFVGDIPDSRKLTLPNVVYHGQLSSKEKIQDLLRSSDVLVCPSYAEGMPNVILEGMASGCAIIASDVGAVSEQVLQDNGWLIQAGSIGEIENAIESAILLSSEELLRKKQRSLERVKETFLWPDIIKKLIASFNHILAKEGKTVI